MNIEPTPNNVALLLSLLLGFINIGLFIYILSRINKLLRSGDGKSLESVIGKHGSVIEELIEFRNSAVDYFKKVDSRIREKVSSKQAIRFNPFDDGSVGGNNSFSVALVDEEGNGSILSSIHTRERTNIFVKPVQGWKSTHDLSDEEQKSLGKQK